ncbi:hypothetical protein ACOSP7_020178 [Xanthoceras sorbifolium]
MMRPFKGWKKKEDSKHPDLCGEGPPANNYDRGCSKENCCHGGSAPNEGKVQ